jgi:NADH-quinone oxidoreductase subunit H
MTPLVAAQIVLTLFVFVMLLNSAAIMVYVERKVAALLQQRVGPYLVGPKGLLQPLADVVKLMFKEELRPAAADAFLFALAPIISATCAFAAFAVVPFGAETTLFGVIPEGLRLQVADVNVAILVVFAIASMSVYGIVLAGWSSNSKYSLLGALRSSAQMISYELSYGLALASVLVVANSLSLTDIVNRQAGAWWHVLPRWFVFVQPIGFLIYMTAGVAETNRAPFDFPEAEQELVAGYHRVRRRDGPVPGGVARAAPAGVARLDLVFGEGGRDSLLLRVDAVDAAAIPVRPADAVRVEGAAARRRDQFDRDRRRRVVFRSVTPVLC